MIKPLLHTWNLNLDYVHRLVKDLPEDKMAIQPAPKTNHAAWVIGHLASTCDFAGNLVGLKPTQPADWEQLFGWSSSPTNEAARYPSKAALLQALDEGHARIAAELPKIPLAKWSDPFPMEEMRGFVPTLGDGLVFILAAHENIHLGQLSAWRRVQGLPSV
jgi:hypothetical protein